MPVSEAVVRLASRGDGVTEAGRHVPGTAPGDRIEGDAVIAGPHRALPPCRHFGRCGGCQLQHVDDQSYRAFITDRIADALAAQGLASPDMAPVHLSPPRARRRATLRAAWQGRAVALGLNAARSNDVVDIVECHILAPPLYALLAPLRALLATLLPRKARATITMTLADQGVDLLIAGIEADDLAATERLSHFATTHRLARLSVDEGLGPSIRAMPAAVTVTLAGVAVALPEGAFLQATADGEAALVAAVREGLDGARRIVDLFAGLGTFALALPGAALAVEGARDAALALKASGRVPVMHRDLFRRPLTASELTPFDAVVLDPPRAGALEQCAALAAAAVPRIAYVSCNPATFARDARLLVDDGFTLARVTPVGQFRWSTHVELAALFTRPR